VAISTCLVAILWASYRYLQAPPEMDRTYFILSATVRTSVTIPLPVSYQSQIAKVPGVVAAMPLRWFDGRYGKDADLVPALAVDARKLLVFLSDWHVAEDQLQAFIGERDALVAGRKAVGKYHWKIGDHVHLRSPNDSDVDLDMVLEPFIHPMTTKACWRSIGTTSTKPWVTPIRRARFGSWPSPRTTFRT
jgi:hypothetical protein